MVEVTPKKILITARNSYIGNSFAAWVVSDDNYEIDFISCRTDDWKKASFAEHDVILHVAGIAHVHASADLESVYYKVNRDLTIELAQKAKREGVKQFIFMSSMIVFGESNAKNRNIVVNKDTKPSPDGFYGNSKLQAEQGLVTLMSNSFKIVIVRPPMVYGKGSKGNYPKLAKASKSLPFFPDINNKRSMLHIDNLCEFIRLVIDNEDYGVFHPQNSEYVRTSDMVKLIANINGKKIILTKIANPIVKILSNRIGMLNKLFGSLVYDKSLSEYRSNYCIRNFEESVELTEGE